jgi:hypothetical protein
MCCGASIDTIRLIGVLLEKQRKNVLFLDIKDMLNPYKLVTILP